MSVASAGGLARTLLLGLAVATLSDSLTSDLLAQGKELSPRAKAADKNGNGVIEPNEAGGPLKDNFAEMDCDKSGSLDGAEIRGFFTGEGCPKTAAAPAPAPAKKELPPLSNRAKAADRNGNGVIDRDEAGGPLKDNFAEMDCDKSGSLDGGEIRGFFTGEGCPKQETGTAAAPAAKPPAPVAGKGGGNPNAKSIRIDTVIREPLSQTYPVIGRLVAGRSGDVAARINGALSELNIDVGERVNKDDVIAKLAEDRLAAERDKFAAAVRTRKAMINTAAAELAKTQQELNRLNTLKTSAAFSRARFEDLTRDVEARKAAMVERQSQMVEAEAELKRAEIDLYNATIRAPYAGVITERHTEVGAYVNVGNAVVSMIKDNDIEIEAEVPTDRVAALKPGTTVRFRLDDGTEHRARVRAVIPNENLRTRTRPVRFTPTFGATRKPLAANQSATVYVPVSAANEVVTVLKDAIVRRGDDTVVYIVRNGRAFPRKIETGEAVGNRYAVVSGLQAGDVVVSHGNETLPPGSAVEIYDDGAAARAGRTEAGIPLWKRLAYVAITRAETRLHWVTRYRLARPQAPLSTDDLVAAPVLELTGSG